MIKYFIFIFDTGEVLEFSNEEDTNTYIMDTYLLKGKFALVVGFRQA